MGKNRDVVGGGCIKDVNSDIVVDEDKVLDVRRAHYEKLSNEEFPWNREALPVVGAVNESCKGEEITMEEVRSATKKIEE